MSNTLIHTQKSLEFVRLCCVKCRRERVVAAFWADGEADLMKISDPKEQDANGWCSHGATCPWGDGITKPECKHGELALGIVQ